MYKILMVEDEKMIADIIIRFFQKKGFKVDVAYDLAEGLEKDSTDYDIILLDINLREEKSFPILKKIKEKDPKKPVLMFSGYDSDENIREAKKLGADGFIPKPLKVGLLQNFLLPKV
ncbi:MAG: response regulator transcription factor, partial [Candidatus Omnitrophota bacterium]